MKNSVRNLLFAAAALSSTVLSAEPLKHPILMLHGYNGSSSTWNDVKARIKESYYEDTAGNLRHPTDSDILVMDYYADRDGGYTSLGCSTDTPIPMVADLVRLSIEEWRDNYSSNATFNVVAHSMGGLVLRDIIADIHDEARTRVLNAGNTNLAFTADTSAGGLFHRCVTLGTPHFGQLLGIDEQSREMTFASPYLRLLADAWHYRGAGFSAMNFIIGNGVKINSHPADILVYTVSASMLTQGDPDFSRRVAYVNRCHTTDVEYTSGVRGLCGMDSVNDTVFKLIHATFSEEPTAYGNGNGQWNDECSANGWRFLYDDGFSSNTLACQNEYVCLTALGLVFTQVVKNDDSPIPYDVGKYFNDRITTDIRDGNTGIQQDLDVSESDTSIPYGLSVAFVGGITASGRSFYFQIGAPSDLPYGYRDSDFEYYDRRTVFGGGGTLIRTYPLAKGNREHTISRTTCAGALSTNTGALYNLGLLTSPDDNAGADKLMSCTAPNGLSWPLCLKLGIAADGTAPELMITSADLTDSGAEIEAKFGEVSYADCGFPYVRLLTGTDLNSINTTLTPSSSNPKFFPTSDSAGKRFFRLSVSE